MNSQREKIKPQSLSAAYDSSSDGSDNRTVTAAGEIIMFGVRVKVDLMRKSVSMNKLSQYQQTPIDSSAVATAADGYASADDAVRNQSNGSRESVD
ncbi:hypothetical protein Hanom_Chr16g01436311 [Helianthus anomalus]